MKTFVSTQLQTKYNLQFIGEANSQASVSRVTNTGIFGLFFEKHALPCERRNTREPGRCKFSSI